MKKIMFYINAIHHGGAERVMVNLTKQFAENGNDCVLVTSFIDEWEYPVSDNVKRISLFEKEIPGALRRNVRLVWALRRLIKQEKPNLLISFMAQPNYRALVACIGLKTKNLISIRNDPNREYAGRINTFLAKTLFKLADGVVFQTEEAKSWFPQSIQNKSRVIYNQVDKRFYDTEYHEERRDIVTTGRLVKQKNHELLIKAFSMIADQIDDNLIIYGDGELREELEALIEKLGLMNRVFLPGATKDVPNTIKSAKLFVLSSDYEGMPNSLMEAMALGLPCISTDCPCGGPKMLFGELLQNNLVPIGNQKLLADQMLNNIVFCRNGQIEREISKVFEPNSIFQKWKSYIDELVVEN